MEKGGKLMSYNKYFETLLNSLTAKGVIFTNDEFDLIDKARGEYDFSEKENERLKENRNGWVNATKNYFPKYKQLQEKVKKYFSMKYDSETYNDENLYKEFSKLYLEIREMVGIK